MALHEYLGATSLADVLTKLKTWIQGEVPKAIPAGGTTGQVLKKASNTDRDVTWGNASSGGGHTIVDGTGTSMADESDLQFVGLSVTDDATNGRTVVDASGKMNTDGSNAASHVVFDNALTVGTRQTPQGVKSYSFSSGYKCGVSGVGGHAEGYYSNAYGDYSHAEGASSLAYGDYSHAENDGSASRGDYSHAEGAAESIGNHSHAEGYGSKSNGNHSHAEGFFTTSELSSHAEGEYTYAYGRGAHCENGMDFDDPQTPAPVTSGIYLDTNINASSNGILVRISSGSSTLLDEFIHSCVKITIGSESAIGYISSKTYLSNRYLYDVDLFDEWGGESYSAGTAIDEICLAHSNLAYGNFSHAEGNRNISHGNYSHAEGIQTLSTGQCSHAEGYRSVASTYSHAEGQETIANGITSHAEGFKTKATQSNAHAEGFGTTASGASSHAECFGATASGAYSHAEGSNTVAYGDNSHAEGNYARANNDSSHAEGYYTKTGAQHQHVQGAWNVGRNDTLFEIGNGTASNDRKNAFEVYTDGSLSTDNGVTKVKLEDLPSKKGGDTYTFHITNTVASNTGVAWCNKVAKFSAPSRAETGVAFTFSVTVRVGENVGSLAFDSDVTITSIYLFDKATVKINNLAAANYTYTATVNSDKDIVLTFTIAAATVTAANATALNAVIDSVSPGFSCLYATNQLALTGTITGNGIVEKIPGFTSAFNTFPSADHITQHVGDFYLPTGSPRWNLEVEVDPGTAYMAVFYLENTTTSAYFNHSICYAGVGVPTFAAPTVAPAPVAGKVIAFVGTTWTPFVAGVAGVVTDGVVTTKPRLRIVGYHANNAPTAGLGMHMRLYRIY